MRYLISVLILFLCGVVFGDYVSLPTSQVFHRADCTYVSGKDPNSLQTKTYEQFIAAGKTPCKSCKPTPEAVEPAAELFHDFTGTFEVTIKITPTRIEVKAVKNPLFELKKHPEWNLKQYAEWANKIDRAINWKFDDKINIWIQVSPLLGTSVYRPVRPVPAPAPTITKEEMLEKLQELNENEK